MSAQRRYLTFCQATNLSPFPPSESVLCLFAVALAHQGLAPQTISSYLAGVRNLEISRGGNPVNRAEMPRLLLVLRGISHSPPRDSSTRRPRRLPITGLVMHRLHGVLSNGRFESRLLWAAACVGFFGFMRAGEFTMVDLSSPPSLCMQDVAVNSRSNPSAIRLHLQRSKTDPTGEGAFIFLGRSGTNVCPVSALLAYLAVRPSRGQHLFVWEDGKPLSRSEFGYLLKKALEAAGLETSQYSGHSLRIGAATSAAVAGVPDHLIKVLGR